MRHAARFRFVAPRLLLVAFLAFRPPPAPASISIQGTPVSGNFDYTYVESAEFNRLAGGEPAAHAIFLFGQYSYIRTPLQQATAAGAKRNVVDHLHSFDLRGGLLFSPRWSLSANLSLNQIQPTGKNSSFQLGDSAVQLRHRINAEEGPIDFGIVGEVLMPTGATNYYLSNGSLGGAIRGVVDYDFKKFRLAANLGYRRISDARWQSIDYRSQMLLGLGALIPISNRWRMSVEGSGALSVPFKAANSPGEYYLGAQYVMSRSAQLLAGASLSGFGSNRNDSFRAIAGLKLALFPEIDTSAYSPEYLHCYDRPIVLTYSGRAPTAAEIAERELPYRVSDKSRKHITNLMLGQMTGLAPGNISYVHDQQVLTAIDLFALPPRKEVLRIDQALLKMRVTKLSKDQNLSTEMLCFIDERACSGDLVQSSNYRPDINPKYFKAGEKPPNRYFSSQFLQHSVGKIGDDRLYSDELTLDVQELLKGTHLGVEALIRGTEAGKPESGATNRKLFISIADDTFVSNDVRLEVTYTAKQCN